MSEEKKQRLREYQKIIARLKRNLNLVISILIVYAIKHITFMYFRLAEIKA